MSFSHNVSGDPPEGERWSTWDGATHGPAPRPEWVITSASAVESDLGILKSGKEADVHLVRRWLPGDRANAANLLAAKRYRGTDHRLFHRDSGYFEGRRVRKSRETRAMRRRTQFGRTLIAGQWIGAEFDALSRLWELGFAVPYPVQLTETELLMEFISEAPDAGAPRLIQTKPSPAQARDYFEQFHQIVTRLAEHGWAHGDLSPYNVLVRSEQLVVIDWPQIVDVVGNPQGFSFLERDVRVMCDWFTRRGVAADADALFGDAAALAVGGAC